MRTPLHAALLTLASVLLGVTLHGCSPEDPKPKSDDLPLEICPAFRFSGSGLVLETRAGDIVQVTCPTDFVYSGPVLECGWIDRFCIAEEGAEIDPKLCWKEYNLTLLGHGLTEWPSSVEPKRVLPPKHGKNVSVPVNAHGDIIVAPANASKVDGDAAPADLHVVRRRLAAGRRQHLGILPTVIKPEQLKCSDEPFVDLDFELARILQNNLGGVDKTAPQNLQFGNVASMHRRSIDLVITASPEEGDAFGLGDASRNGKGSAMGRINVNSSRGVPLKFRLVASDDQMPVTVNKMYFTIFDVDPGLVRPNPPTGLEVIVESLSQYHIAPHSRVAVKQNNTQYKFRGAGQPPAGAAPPEAEAQAADAAAGGDGAGAGGGAGHATVKDLWLDSLNGSVVLVFRNVSEFTLVVSTKPSSKGRDFEFTGWSEIVQEGRRVVCGSTPEEEEGDDAHADAEDPNATAAAATRAALEKKFKLAGGAPVLRPTSGRSRGVLVSLGLGAVAISVVLAVRRQARLTRAQYGVLLSS